MVSLSLSPSLFISISLFLSLVFHDRISLCFSPGFVDEAGLEFTEICLLYLKF